ncbi:hypothetical protein DRN86_02740 [Candidatus Geothermarchaeota archaeon]|nr:MAG: hypothetical protein DRN86_02740 [Candidatus Geothermarchaeota archaeon]
MVGLEIRLARGNGMERSSGVKYCVPSCPFFKCAKRALRVINGKYMCVLTADFCEPTKCNFVICIVNKYLPGGICGKAIKRVTKPIRFSEGIEISKDRIKGKLKDFRDEFL